MRGIIGIALGLALAVAGTIAVAGSSYTPPAASGGGVEGDGTGVTDAAAFRSELGLGTAAVSAVDDFLPSGTSATGIGYTPADGADWTNPDPAEVGSGLDALAQRLADVEGAGWQAGSAALTDWSDVGVVSAADLFPYSTGEGVWAYGAVTSAGRGLIDDADASAMRTTLGLGTAATVATGTSAGNVVVLDGSARLPAVDGSQLTNLPAGSPYSADAWDAVWEAADGATGWTTSGTSTTNGIATTGGKSSYTVITASPNSAYAYRTLAPSAPDGSFELRANIYLGTQHASSDPNSWVMFCAFGRLHRIILSSYGLGLYASSGGAVPVASSGVPTSEWITVTLRVTSPDEGNTAPTATAVTVELWLGETYAGAASSGSVTTCGGTGIEAAGAFSVGTTTGLLTSAVAWAAYRDGHNDAPPSYTYRGLGYAPDVAAP